MRRRRPLIRQRELYFVGCEGDGERAYVALLNTLAQDRGLHLWIQAEPLNPGAGDPLALVERAVERLAHKRRNGVRYRHKAIFLDWDRAEETPERTQRAIRLSQQKGIQLVWQRPNLEAVLLRHLDGCQQLDPPADRSLIELQKRWPEYQKSGISGVKLWRRIGFDAVMQSSWPCVSM